MKSYSTRRRPNLTWVWVVLGLLIIGAVVVMVLPPKAPTAPGPKQAPPSNRTTARPAVRFAPPTAW